MKRQKVVVAMSGGVDSSVSALILKEQGYDVIGLFMKNWDETDERGVCTATLEFEDVSSVCKSVGIPYYAVNFTSEYRDRVFADFLKEYQAGRTPNPDILCNREIKFQVLLDKALELGADYLATGHYCQIKKIDGKSQLSKGADPGKDQSYFLYTLKHSILDKVLFPVGGIQKPEVRELARKYGLTTSEKKDSTGICFIGERKFRQFLSQYLPIQSGAMVTLEGEVVGQHQGIAFYTIGQRKGLGIGGRGDAWFVIGKDIEKNILYVAQGEDHPRLFANGLVATDLSWVADVPVVPFECMSKVRYRQADQPCVIESIVNGVANVSFPIPQRAVTPGQSVVFYKDDICLGGGIIQ